MLQKITAVIDEEMEAIRASRIEMPQILSSTLWHKTGRVRAMGSELFRLKDRRGAEMILAPTHEEEVTKLIGAEIDSAKALPVRVYQIGRKFRDEPRPRAGLLRTKEFLMKDMYSFDASVDQAKQAYEDTRQAYAHIFNRLFDWHHVPALVSSCAPTWLEATADTGAMGGTFSHEFHMEDEAGEDTLLRCQHCHYTSNVECATSHKPSTATYRTSQDLSVSLFQGDNGLHAFVYGSDRQLNPLSLPTGYQLTPVANDLSAQPMEIWVDTDCTSVASEEIRHAVQQHVNSFPTPFYVPTDCPVHTKSLREAKAGDVCATCGQGTLSERKAIEIGHTFLLGTRYSRILGYGVVPRNATNASQTREPLQMGCYGIGVTRILGAMAQRASRAFTQLQAAAAPTSKKGKPRAGFVWPQHLAPFSALILPATSQHLEAAARLCHALHRGVSSSSTDGTTSTFQVPLTDMALDDRIHQSLGSRLFDADLLGSPLVFEYLSAQMVH
ncbi:prolyl-trna synthetase [Malassezia pachydermatis]|uniref:proline--tRNA ligase n=1 Tax=Malassezia pachydermatis TaxID=77020 RepID=A0A0M8MXQ3_9BASI|nr:prolyl-trna synthetase [Malassezia pachydermatis]KOS15671.1 prolyl-trna synthetase [Malassezia pachydermatis]